jgi:integrase
MTWIAVEQQLLVRSKNGRPRTIPLSSRARQIAEVQLEDLTTGKYLFTSNRTGGMIAEIKTAFTAAVRDAGIEDFRFHDLRHTFSTRLNEAGVDPFTIRDLLGHSSTTITADYTHTSHESRRRGIEMMGRNSNSVLVHYGKIPA